MVRAFLRQVLERWRTVAGLIGKVNTVVVLAAVFFFVLTPIALLLRPFRKGISLEGAHGWLRRAPGGNRERQF